MYLTFLIEGEIKLFEPFCGSGTIPLTALACGLNIPIRKNLEEFSVVSWPQYSKELHLQTLDDLSGTMKSSIRSKEKIC